MTGEEKRTGCPDGSAASHVAITIEMAPVDRKCKLRAFYQFVNKTFPEQFLSD